MWNWMKIWRRSEPATLPAEEEVSSRAPATDGIRQPAPGDRPGTPRYAFTAFDPRAPRPGAFRSTSPAPGDPGGEPILGIDLGTTSVCACVVVGRSVLALPGPDGELLTPCVIARTDDGEWLVGEAARRQGCMRPRATTRSFKRFLGRPGPLALGDEAFPPQQLAGLVLRHIRNAAEKHLGRSLRRAVIAVPGCFDQRQRGAVVQAVQLAGLDVDWQLTDPGTLRTHRLRMRLVREPTAAALGVGMTTAWQRQVRVCVLHHGGGTFDVSLLELGDGVVWAHATAGESDLGGDELDRLLLDRLAAGLRRRHGLDPRGDAVAWWRLGDAVEQARRDLSAVEQTHISLAHLLPRDDGWFHLDIGLSRHELEELARPLFERCRTAVERALADAHWKAGDVEEVALVGGLTRMPLFARLVDELFGPHIIRRSHPAEIVAAGAAIQGHQLSLGSTSDMVLVDVAPLALHVARADGSLACLIPRNSSVPIDRKETLFVPLEHGRACVRVYQGEGGSADSNLLLGEVILDGVTSEMDRAVQVEVTLSMSHDSLVEVMVKAPDGREQRALLAPETGLGEVELEQLCREQHQQEQLRNWRSS
jgi:molecular chaperone DnaK